MPGKPIAAEVGYEVGIVNGPYKFTLRGVEFEVESGQDIVVLQRVTRSGNKRIDEKIVGVIGSEWRTDSREFLNLREFLLAGGVVGLDQNLQR